MPVTARPHAQVAGLLIFAPSGPTTESGNCEAAMSLGLIRRTKLAAL